MIRVVNVRGLRTPEQRAGCVYVGRTFAGWQGHPLANPFRVGDSREACLDRYRDWLLARPTLEADLRALWEQTGRGRLPLGCWCKPDACHGDILAEQLELIGVKE